MRNYAEGCSQAQGFQYRGKRKLHADDGRKHRMKVLLEVLELCTGRTGRESRVDRFQLPRQVSLGYTGADSRCLDMTRDSRELVDLDTAAGDAGQTALVCDWMIPLDCIADLRCSNGIADDGPPRASGVYRIAGSGDSTRRASSRSCSSLDGGPRAAPALARRPHRLHRPTKICA